MNYLKQISCLLCLIIVFSCSERKLTEGRNSLIKAEIYAPVYPVLIGKQNNLLAQVNIKVLDSLNDQVFRSMTLELDGDINATSIKGIKIYQCQEDGVFNPEGKLIANLEVGSRKLRLEGSHKLSFGDNKFWLTCALDKTAKVEDGFSLIVSAIEVNKNKIFIGDNNKLDKRIGHALRQHNDDNVHTYRIPGLVTTNQGTLIAVYDMRRNGAVDLQEDIDIGMNRSIDGGQSWSTMEVIMDMEEWGGLPEGQNGIGDPSILVDRVSNTIWVAAVWAHGHPGERNWWASKPGMTPQTTSQFVLVKSEDDGLSWSAPINITPQIKNTKWHLLLQGPGKGITMDDGTLVFPAQFKDENQMPHSTIIYSTDAGEHWQIGTGAKSNTTEAQVVELSDGSLMLNMRDNRGNGPDGKTGLGARSVYITKDLGATWVKHPTSFKALPEPVCMASLIKHAYEESQQLNSVLLFSNPIR